MKVIFLDIDGVLNNDLILKQFRRLGCGAGAIGLEKLQLLQKIVTVTNAQIVLSSDWRLAHVDPCGYKMVRICLGMFGIRIVGRTPDLLLNVTGDRANEIQAWLGSNQEKRGVTHFVILDDRTDAGLGFPDNFILTNDKEGLTEQQVEEAIQILTRPKIIKQ